MLNEEHLRVLSVPVGTSRGTLLGVLQVGRSIEPERSALSRLVLILGLSEAGALALAVVGGRFLANRALVPIRRSFDRQRQFVADASHELRTPLALIRSSGELLARHGDQTVDENRQLVDGIISETEYLNGLVSGLLTLAQSDAGRLGLRRENVALDDLVRSVADDARPLAQSRGLELRYDNVTEPVTVQGDPERLRQLLLLLLDNSFKYTPQGGSVVVSLERDTTEVRLAVADTGSGIAEEHLPHLFDRFYRADLARGRDIEGAGLGLSIAKALIEAHDGSINVDSIVEQGTKVEVRLPMAERGVRAPEPPTTT